MISEIQMAYGSCVLLHGKSRLTGPYHSSSAWRKRVSLLLRGNRLQHLTGTASNTHQLVDRGSQIGNFIALEQRIGSHELALHHASLVDEEQLRNQQPPRTPLPEVSSLVPVHSPNFELRIEALNIVQQADRSRRVDRATDYFH